MRHLFRTRPGRILATALLAALVVMTGSAVAAYAGVLPGEIYACVNNSSGTIHITTPTGTCANNEVKLGWNSQGIQGPQGPIGPQGAPGSQGPFATVSTGIVNGDGSFDHLAGGNYTAYKISTGVYFISFPYKATPFSWPIIVTQPWYSAGQTFYVSNSGCDVFTDAVTQCFFHISSSDGLDGRFSFVVTR